jgi:hypothetical protein
VDDSRTALVREAANRWRGQLIDLGGRNSLLYYRDLKAGTLDLGEAAEAARTNLLDGRRVSLSQLFPEPERRVQALRRARVIRNKARELHEERGIETCFLAVGMATWTNPKAGGAGGNRATPAAPVLLRTAIVRARGAAEDDFDVVLTGEAELNPTLVHLLATDFDVEFDVEQVEDLVEYSARFDPAAVFERLRKEAAGRVHGFAIAPRFVLGTFSYAKLPMVTDLRAAEDVLVDHEVIAAVAGDRLALAGLSASAGADIDVDQIAPADEYLVLDADSSQHQAINSVLGGRHTVIKGPPGTGKSQTIANLIAALVADGKRVLFVAEKRAAILAVTDRLARCGLAGLVMDVHDGTATRRRIAAELKTALENASRIALPDLTRLHETLADRRERLNAHVAALHEPRAPWGVSVFEAQATLAGLDKAAASRVRVRGAALTALATAFPGVREKLREYASLGGFALSPEQSAWAGAVLATPMEAQSAYEVAGRLASTDLASTRALVERITIQCGLSKPDRIRDWEPMFVLLGEVEDTLAILQPSVFGAPLPELIAACEKRFSGWFARRRIVRTYWRGNGKPGRARLSDVLVKARNVARRWATVSRDGGPPRVPQDLPVARTAYARFRADLATLANALPETDFGALRPDEAQQLLQRLASDERTVRKIPRLNALSADLSGHGLADLVAELRSARADPDAAIAGLDRCWYASILEHIGFTDLRIGAFDGTEHSRIAAEFVAGDHEHIVTTAVRVQRAVAEHVVAVRDQYPDESRLVEHQANLKRRHLPVRQLFAVAPHMLTALKPCWAMSPLVVSRLLPAGRQYFDVVVFDEASQVTPADAVPAIMRARQVVVAGDEHQLPPTAFFTSADDSDTSPLGVTAEGAIDLALTTGYESILDVLSAVLPGYMLRWHYRSQDERLIGFSNARIYNRSLVTFPGATGAGCLTHVLVTPPPARAEEATDSVTAEVDRVVALVLEHAASRPGESLGVITMGITHADRIDLALRRALANRPQLHGFFAEDGAEPFFVKNLERVQGDERDAIILSIGYGKSASGRLLYRFGPLLMAGGERRLNVAVTRARRRMTLVSSFSAADMDPDRSTSEGVRLLRAYLQYAESGGNNLGTATVDRPPLGPLGTDIRDRLTTAGIPVLAQFGVGDDSIEFGAVHPSRPGELVLAIETDGLGYRASGSARDRDRLRQEHLRRLGWGYHRIWTSDWLQDPDREVERVRHAYDAAVAGSAPSGLRSEATTEDGAAQGPPPPLVEASIDAEQTMRLEPGAGRPLPRPQLPTGVPITAYEPEELVALIRWIESDTLLRTEEEVIDEVMRELGLKRRGPRIREAIVEALREARTDPSPPDPSPPDPSPSAPSPTDRSSPDRSSPDRSSPDRSSPDRSSPDPSSTDPSLI